MQRGDLCPRCNKRRACFGGYCSGAFCLDFCAGCGVAVPEGAMHNRAGPLHNAKRCCSGATYCREAGAKGEGEKKRNKSDEEEGEKGDKRERKRARTPLGEEGPRNKERRLAFLKLRAVSPPAICLDLGDLGTSTFVVHAIGPRARDVVDLSASLSVVRFELAELKAELKLRVDPAQQNLAQLFATFCNTPGLRERALDAFRQRMIELRTTYKRVKAALLVGAPTSVDLSSHEGGGFSGSERRSKSWAQKVKALGADDADRLEWAGRYAAIGLPNTDVACIAMPDQADWFAAMIALKLVRKKLVGLNITLNERVEHVTVLNFPGFSLFAVNSRRRTAGTTRMVWPVTRDPDHAETVTVSGEGGERKALPFLRVLDLAYSEVYTLLRVLCDQGGYDEPTLATCLLQIVRSERLPERCRTRRLDLTYWYCSFLYGVTLSEGRLAFVDPEWRLSKKSRSAKNLADFGVQVTHYEAMCYVLSILFLAEPRHALGMWHATARALELVAQGRLGFGQLFGRLELWNGDRDEPLLKGGRLLPGANTLKGLLSPADKRLAMPLVDSVLYEPDNEGEDAPPINAQVAVKSQNRIHHDRSFSFEEKWRDRPNAPVYEPLLKALFLEFLALSNWAPPLAEEEARGHSNVEAYDGEYDDSDLADLL